MCSWDHPIQMLSMTDKKIFLIWFPIEHLNCGSVWRMTFSKNLEKNPILLDYRNVLEINGVIAIVESYSPKICRLIGPKSVLQPFAFQVKLPYVNHLLH